MGHDQWCFGVLSWRGVGQNDDRRLQALGAMDGHHTNFVTNTVHLTLDLKIIGVQPDEKPSEIRNIAALIGQRLADQSINPFGGFWSQLAQ